MEKIYALSDPRTDEIRYVGWTKHTIGKRIVAHVEEAKRLEAGKARRTHKNRWVLSLVRRGLRPVGELLEETNDPDEAGRRWIRRMREEGARLTNATPGGKGSYGARWKLTTEQRRAISERETGRKKSPDEVEKMRARARGNKNWLGRKHGEETKTKLRAIAAERRAKKEAERAANPPPPKPPRKPSYGHLGKKHSEETKAKFSRQRKGRPRDPEAAARAAESNRGRKRTPEQKARIAAGKKAAWARKKGGHA